ncbi:ABC1 kinase family protein [Prochlorococcus sp. MIT 0603]|nr:MULTISPECIES: AarF/ABC1/UbiB kinase family protein [unclassified Prochlorococcus]KGG15438.1 Ubiquinone biosynthesis monooxygenase UbiB [Prochlorococcus sp. MIT 0602]KGG17717.1 Ubiquinone biosynthesis monooxygenase UbiB [Prochlorococcus sp. MIT 0603]
MVYNAKRDLIWLILRPWILIPRIIQIIFIIIKFIIRFLLEANSEDKNVQKGLAEYLLNTISKLGPCFIKLGQALSTRPDLIKQEWLDELTRLQDDLPRFDHKIALKIFETEIGQPVDKIFTDFPNEPIASASLGQVYKAKLDKDYTVAVKIQRPNLTYIIRRDLVIIRIIAVISKPFLPLNLGFGIGEIIDEFGISLFKEIDYEQEAKNAERFAALFSNNKTIVVPRVENIISSKKVITTSWIEGIKMKSRGELIQNGIDPTAIIRSAVTSGIQQLLEFGYFHADPHPGNLFALKGKTINRGHIGYVDFGMMDYINDKDRITLTGAIVHLINNDYLLLAKDFQRLGFLSSDQNLDEIAVVLKEVLGGVINKDVNSLNLKTVTDKFSDLMFDYPFRVPSRFALIIRAVVSQEGLAIRLDPDFKIIRFAYPYIAKRLLTDQSEELLEILMDIIFDKQNKLRVDRLESLLEVIEESSNQPIWDLLPVARNGVKLLVSSKGSNIRKKLLMSLIKNDEFNIDEMKELLKLISKKFDPMAIGTQFIKN